MIDLILNIVISYLVLGTIVLPLLIGWEMVLISNKGEDFKGRLRNILGISNGPLPIYKAIGTLLRWPMFAGTFLVARLKGKTMLEFIADDIEERKNNLIKAQEYTMAVLEGKIPIRRDWITVNPEDTEFLIHFYRSHYTTEIIPHHLVVEYDGGNFTAWRLIGNDFERNLPLAAGTSLKTLKRLCEQDDVWLAVSQPGLEDERERFWAKEIERFEDEAELDLLASEVIKEQDPNEVALDDSYDGGKTIKTD